MNSNAYAVFIGVNACLDLAISRLLYAEKDCRDLQSVLADPRTGNFPAENTTLVIGQDATTKTVKRILYRDVVGRSDEDTVLVYLSGHGIVRALDNRRRTYFGTYDTSIQDITTFPHEGLDMDFLHNEIFLATRARVVLFILDCCHSGAIVPATIRDTPLQIQFVKTDLPQQAFEFVSSAFSASANGRIALVACPPDAVSRESTLLKNGIFTHWVLKGLRGEAVEMDSGEVTVDSLTSYLRSKVPADQPAGRYGQDFGRIVLTRPARSRGDIPSVVIPRARLRPTPAYASQEFSYLTHPLERCQAYIADVLDQISEDELGSERAPIRLLEAMRIAARAECAFFLRQEDDNLILGARSPYEISSGDLEQIASLIPTKHFEEHSSRRSNHGFSLVYRRGKRGLQSLIVAPTSFNRGSDFLVICGFEARSPWLTDVFGTTLSAVISAHRRILEPTKNLFEAAILDDLKHAYGFIPAKIYNRRLELFRARLSQMTVYFQPVVYIGRKHVGIDSWEALARDPSTGRTPFDLFDTAELWGREFMSELDRHFLLEETQKFQHACQKIAPGLAPDLSINVYPKSLIGGQYYQAMKEILDGGIIVPEKLVLEISEKVSLHDLAFEGSEEEGVELFRGRLETFVKDFQIGFAIDDFGIRQASVSNLARLHPDIVKIDRDALLHEFSNPIIRLVVDLTRARRLRHTKVVVEGFDTDSRITLRQIYNLGVRYVQGFSLGKPAPQLYHLEDSKVQEIRRCLAGEEDDPVSVP